MPDFTGNTNPATFFAQNGIQQSGMVSEDEINLNAFGTDPNALASSFRASNIPVGAEANYDFVSIEAQFSQEATELDWRVRISCDLIYSNSEILSPLQETQGMIFPYLPNITISHTANYQQMDIAHMNYPFYAYKNSQVDEISIQGKFTVQNAKEARYWIAAVHFLRSVTKMYFGQGPNLGNPPPICLLNGYGDYVFPNVPCIVKSFNVVLPENVDYIESNAGTRGFSSGETVTTGASVTYVPVSSDITVTVQPIYSREEIKSFNLQEFASGKMLIASDGNGFI